MARPRSSSPPPAVSSGQASYVLERLIKDRRVSPSDVNRYVTEMRDEISDLERRLQQLREAHGIQTRGQTGVRPGPARRPGRPGRPPGRPPGYAPAVPPTPSFLPPFPKPPKAPPPGPQKGPEDAKRKFTVTPEVVASRQLQGRYLALVRQMPEGQRQKYSKTAKKQGREAAIREMTRALKK